MKIDNAYEHKFEQIIRWLLDEMGFENIEMRYLSNGIVDIEATNKALFFSGLYIIRIFDEFSAISIADLEELYKTIIQKKACKGILVSRLYFSEEVKEFAKDKKLELIDKDDLNKLIEQSKLGFKTYTEHSNKKSTFVNFSQFNLVKYEYLKKKAINSKDKKSYEKLASFLNSYIQYGNMPILKAGLINEILEINNLIAYKYCKNTKKQQEEANTYKIINAYLYMLLGNIRKCFELCDEAGILRGIHYRENYIPKKYGIACLRTGEELLPTLDEIPRVICEENNLGISREIIWELKITESEYLIITNLYNIAKYFKCYELSDKLESSIFRWCENRSMPFSIQAQYNRIIEDEFNSSVVCSDFRNMFFYPYMYVEDIPNDQEGLIMRESHKILMEEFVNNFYKGIEEEIKTELRMIGSIL